MSGRRVVIPDFDPFEIRVTIHSADQKAERHAVSSDKRELIPDRPSKFNASVRKEFSPGVATNRMRTMEASKETRKGLKPARDDVPDAHKAADTSKKLLSNLATVVQCVAELRNRFGTGHGHEGRAKGLKPRHARLAAGAATLATFLLETHLETQPGGRKPSAEPA